MVRAVATLAWMMAAASGLMGGCGCGCGSEECDDGGDGAAAAATETMVELVLLK